MFPQTDGLTVGHLVAGRRLLHPLGLQLGDLGLQQVDHLLVVHLHPPRLLLGRLRQVDPRPQSPALLSAELYVLPTGGGRGEGDGAFISRIFPELPPLSAPPPLIRSAASNQEELQEHNVSGQDRKFGIISVADESALLQS